MLRRGRSGGFLIEVMVAVAILATGLLALFNGVGVEIIRSSNASLRRTARVLTERKLSEILVGLETATEGTFEDEPEFSWAVEQNSVSIGQTQATQLILKIKFSVEDEDGVVTEEEAKAITYLEASQ